MNVLHVMNSASGGAALSTLGLMRQLQKYGVESSAACYLSGTLAEKQAIMDATDGRTVFTPLYWWNRKTRPPKWRRFIIEMRQLLRTGCVRRSSRIVANAARQYHADLIHSNTILTIEGANAARTLGIPHIWHLRELVGPGQTFQFAMSQERLGQFIEARCDALIANSYASARLIQPFVRSDLLHIIPNGIDLAPFGTVEHDRPSGKVIVAMVANLTSRSKNHDLFIRSAMQVGQELPVEFRIYGHDPSNGGAIRGGAYIDGLHSLVNASPLKNRFRWMGFVDKPEQIMSEIDLLVHPTETESFGRIAVEAMAAGLPVVGVRGGGIGEIVQDGITGLLAEPGDAAGIAARIESLVTNPQLRLSMGHTGTQVAAERYSLEACTNAVLHVYKRLHTYQAKNL